MASPDREEPSPFLVRVFCKNGSFHRPDEFSARKLPTYLPLYTFPSCTLTELAHLVVAEDPTMFSNPSVGTRVAFRLVYPDIRNPPPAAHHAPPPPPRFMVKDLGSVVLGGDIAAAKIEAASKGADDDGADVDMEGAGAESLVADLHPAKDKALSDFGFVVGDYVCCAVLPPLSDGSVAPALTARNDRSGPGPASHNQRRDAGFGGRLGRDRDRDRDRDRRQPDFEGGFPEGEWRRGERLPEGPSERARGRGRRTDRW
ncbi:Histone deacetylase complex subunit SAP18 [Colletotrichum trifolii]|uniref:Histone deacetylase complex subunit SAP18 n=1 Tax=Colletotrichum trifolii TaxID=5466 RepID=A0A4R8RXX8_COLTR|nr:Histone deacetylase complex subunit SAP18 [Colletotrichum trifolii]